MKFEILDSESPTQRYYWRIIADNGRELARSELLISKAYAATAAQNLKAYADTGRYRFNVETSNSVAQPWKWNVTTANHEKVVASSENYHNRADTQAAADSLRANAKYAQIVDRTRSAARS